MYQDEIAQNPEMRALYFTNCAVPDADLQVVDRLADGLWLASNLEPRLFMHALRALGCKAEAFPNDSLGVPFRDTVRTAFKFFVRINGGPSPVV